MIIAVTANEEAVTAMDDLISRQAAIDAIRASTLKYTGFMEMEMYTDDDAVEAIEGLPSAQPEIIRCKDCRHCNLGCDDNDNQYYSCTVRFDDSGFWNEVGAEDFCSWAERRSDDRDKRQ